MTTTTIIKNENTLQLAVRSKISSKLIFASCVWYSDRAHYELCVLIKDIGRRRPLQQLQCSYQGQQGDFSQSVRGNYKTRFWGGQNLTAVEGNVSFYQVNLLYIVYSVAIRVNRVILVSLCAETIKPVSEGDKIWQLWWREMYPFIKWIYYI